MNDALVVSDIHLGSDVCCAKQLTDLLSNLPDTKRLILNGDVFDSHDFRRLKKHHWKVLSLIRKLSDQIEIIWVAGNHDGPADVISQLLGVQVVEEYQFISGDKSVLILHGDVFDEFINKRPIVTWFADAMYKFAQRVDKSHTLGRWLKSKSKTYLRCASVIEEKAITYAKSKQADVVCCGHVHKAEIKKQYCNSGCWTELPCSYLIIKDGIVDLAWKT